jgi:hypothetical protein
MAISGTALAALGAGTLFLYSSLTGKKFLAEAQAIIQGKSPATAAGGNQIQGTGATVATSSSSPLIAAVSGQPGSLSAAANITLGQLMAAAYGWGAGANWSYLRTGWQEESGWSTTAANVPSDPYDNAYGIPQANPGTKMASAGADWKTSAATQIKWGLDYIKQTYGSPVGVPGWSTSGPTEGYTGY